LFEIPDFQRDYSWTVDDEISDFWSDLSKGLDDAPYFLGLLIVTENGGVKTVVDGQQRILTLTLLANSIRRAALARGKNLVADSMRDVFLYAIDYEKNARTTRVKLVSERDRNTLLALLESRTPEGAINDRLQSAQTYLDRKLEAALSQKGVKANSLLGRWAQFISSGIIFALFEHPDRNAAYKVFEVVNNRGKDLTPAQIIKSYVIGSTEKNLQRRAYERWVDLEEQFIDIGAQDQFTQFVRHVVTLRHGYVEPRDLYQSITEKYEGSLGADLLLGELEAKVPTYLQMVSPLFDENDAMMKAFAVLDTLNLRTVRPLFLAAAGMPEFEVALAALMKIVVPRIATGSFGTGSTERLISQAAQEIFTTGVWEKPLEHLEELRPKQSEFLDRVEHRGMSKGVQFVLRASAMQQTVLPVLSGFAYQVRPRNVDDWPDFPGDDFKALGSTIGNWIITDLERRPRGANSLDGAIDKLLPHLEHYEDQRIRTMDSWSADDVRSMNSFMKDMSRRVWYG
jgi:hypothetical protein